MDAAGNRTSDPNATQLTLESSIVELTAAAARELGLGGFAAANADQEGQHQLWANEQAQQFLQRIKDTEGADLLSAPKILISNGTEGSVSMTEPFQAPNGHELQLGPIIKILPRIDSKTDQIELAVRAEINRRTGNEPQ